MLDANVLFPSSLRDLLLRCAEAEFYVPIWTERILNEAVRSTLEEGRMNEGGASRLLAALRRAFPEAMIGPDGVDLIEDRMQNAEEDRHVLATAVVSGAEGIVTANLRHFPDAALAPFYKQAIHPDAFLCLAIERHGAAVFRIVEQQASELVNPPHATAEVLDHLQLGGAVAFVAQARDTLALPQRTNEEILAEREVNRP